MVPNFICQNVLPPTATSQYDFANTNHIYPMTTCLVLLLVVCFSIPERGVTFSESSKIKHHFSVRTSRLTKGGMFHPLSSRVTHLETLLHAIVKLHGCPGCHLLLAIVQPASRHRNEDICVQYCHIVIILYLTCSILRICREGGSFGLLVCYHLQQCIFLFVISLQSNQLLACFVTHEIPLLSLLVLHLVLILLLLILLE